MEIKYNDNELLYLFSEGIEEALEILFEKYVGLIRKRISTFKIQKRYQDDFLQEGMMTLLVAARTYYQGYAKTFNKYFDLILQRRFIKIIKSEKNYIYNVTLFEDYSKLPAKLKEEVEFEYEENDVGILSELENKVYKELKKGLKGKEIAEKLNISSKTIYNCVYRIKSKMH